MLKKELEELKNSLKEIVAFVGGLSEDNFGAQAQKDLLLFYKEIRVNFSSLSEKEVLDNFTSNEIKVLKFLEVGQENEDKFNELFNQIKKDKEETVAGVVNFLKSRKGLELLSKDDGFGAYSDQDLLEIFGNLFGIQMAADCVQSFKTEKVSRVLGYALSGLCETHSQEYEKMQKNGSFTGSRADYFKAKINECDVEASFTFKEDGENGENKIVNAWINENISAKATGVRGPGRIDNCFINNVEKTITLGFCTSAKDITTQNYTYHKAYVALEELTKQETVDNAPNPYYGYKVNAYYLMVGLFAVDTKEVSQQKGRDLVKMFSGLNLEQKQQIGQLLYYNLFANSPSPDVAATIIKYNTFIAGCDTLSIYEQQEQIKLIAQNDKKITNELSYLVLLESLTKTSNYLNKSEIGFNKRGKTDLKIILEGLVNVVEKNFVNFHGDIEADFYETNIKPLHASLKDLRDKIKKEAGYFGNDIVNKLSGLVLNLSSVERYNEKISITTAPVAAKIIWKKEAPQQLFNNNTAEEGSEVIFKENAQNLPLVASSFMNSMVNQSRLKRDLLQRIATIAHEVLILGKNPKECKNKLFTNEKNYNSQFNQLKTHLLKNNNYGVYNFLQHLNPLLKKTREEYNNPDLYDNHIRKFIDYLQTDFIKSYPFYEKIIFENLVKEKNNKLK